MSQCEAEVRRLVRRGPSGRFSGSRQVNTYEYGRCSREATVHNRPMYPPDDADYAQAMHPVRGSVCAQHNQHPLPRKAARLTRRE